MVSRIGKGALAMAKEEPCSEKKPVPQTDQRERRVSFNSDRASFDAKKLKLDEYTDQEEAVEYDSENNPESSNTLAMKHSKLRPAQLTMR